MPTHTTAHTPLPIAAPADIGLCPERTAHLLQVLRKRIAEGHLPGAVLLVARRGHIGVLEALGQQDPARGTPMRSDSLFRIYSMTKPIASVAAMMLVERGQMLLSDPVARHLPEFAQQQVWTAQGLVPAQRPATVHDLLRHTAGLSYEFLGDGPVQRRYAELRLHARDRPNAEHVQALASAPLAYQPGSTWAYSRATDVLGRLIEVVSGHSLGAFLQREIFEPLGMHDTGFAVPEPAWARLAEPFAHDPDGGTPMKVFDARQAAALENAGGGLVSSAMDYARFLHCLSQRGTLGAVRLLSPQTVDFMTADHLGTLPIDGELLPPGHGFGLGFAVRTTPGLANLPGSVGLYYWGGIAGTTFFVDPAQELYAVLMIQAPNQREHYRELLRNLVYAALV